MNTASHGMVSLERGAIEKSFSCCARRLAALSLPHRRGHVLHEQGRAALAHFSTSADDGPREIRLLWLSDRVPFLAH
jgi:hypothetical protein